jgi:hypothetical protein
MSDTRWAGVGTISGDEGRRTSRTLRGFDQRSDFGQIVKVEGQSGDSYRDKEPGVRPGGWSRRHATNTLTRRSITKAELTQFSRGARSYRRLPHQTNRWPDVTFTDGHQTFMGSSGTGAPRTEAIRASRGTAAEETTRTLSYDPDPTPAAPPGRETATAARTTGEICPSGAPATRLMVSANAAATGRHLHPEAWL